ncbi:MAG: bacillithiol biosynthesis protein BshC [Thermoanaerobaculia bacterium]
MTNRIIPFDRYPNLPPLFRAFREGRSGLFPGRPEADTAAALARQILGRKARVSASAFRYRDPAGRQRAQALANGRAVAVVAGHQVGLFTGPLFALLKAFDAIRVAREISASGVPAVAVFYALTDDHDLEEIAKTARPGAEGPEVLILEGADRANRRPVGPLPIPSRVTQIVEAFRPDSKAPDAGEILDAFARRSAPGVSYADAFVETLFDLVDPEPLLVLDPLAPEAAAPAAAFFLEAVRRQADVGQAWRASAERIAAAGHEAPVAYRAAVFPFFLIAKGERRRASDVAEAALRVEAGRALPSADVLTRPALKSWLLPAAASILGPAEIAYHAQSLALFPIFDLKAPVLVPRTLAVLTGPAERRAAQALGLTLPDLLARAASPAAPAVPEAGRLASIARNLESELDALEPALKGIDPTLSGALETARRKVAYQIEQLVERIRKAAERRHDVAAGRRRRLETMICPGGAGADRMYPPLVWLLAHGRPALSAIRDGASGSLEGAVVIELDAEAPPETTRAG